MANPAEQLPRRREWDGPATPNRGNSTQQLAAKEKTDARKLGSFPAFVDLLQNDRLRRKTQPEAMQESPPHDALSSDQARQMVAEFIRLLGSRAGKPASRHSAAPKAAADQAPRLSDSSSFTSLVQRLSPRQRQTLERLLSGDSEKEVAHRLGISPHTIHVHVKSVYKLFDVSSRGELLARFIKMPR